MPSNCAVATCKTDTNITRVIGVKRALFRFPKCEKLRQIWIRSCHRKDPFNVNNARICSLHFREEDFEEDVRAKMLNVPAKFKLKGQAIPTLQLGLTSSPKMESECSKKQRLVAREEQQTKQRMEYIVHVLNFEKPDEKVPGEITDNIASASISGMNNKNEANRTLQNTNDDLLDKNARLEKKLQEQSQLICKYRKNIRSLNLQLRKLKSKEKNNKSKNILSKFEKCFTPAQIQMIVSDRKNVHWSPKDMSIAFTLRYFSKQGYEFLQDILNYPLPSLSSLDGWASKLDIRPGELSTVIKYVELASETMEEEDEQKVELSFDEMKVASISTEQPIEQAHTSS